MLVNHSQTNSVKSCEAKKGAFLFIFVFLSLPFLLHRLQSSSSSSLSFFLFYHLQQLDCCTQTHSSLFKSQQHHHSNSTAPKTTCPSKHLNPRPKTKSPNTDWKWIPSPGTRRARVLDEISYLVRTKRWPQIAENSSGPPTLLSYDSLLPIINFMSQRYRWLRHTKAKLLEHGRSRETARGRIWMSELTGGESGQQLLTVLPYV